MTHPWRDALLDPPGGPIPQASCSDGRSIFRASYTPAVGWSAPAVVFWRVLPPRPQGKLDKLEGFNPPDDRCVYCGVATIVVPDVKGKPPSVPTARTRDHILPKVRGGSSTRRNIVLVCRRCNTHKGNRLPSDPDWDADDVRKAIRHRVQAVVWLRNIDTLPPLRVHDSELSPGAFAAIQAHRLKVQKATRKR